LINYELHLKPVELCTIKTILLVKLLLIRLQVRFR